MAKLAADAPRSRAIHSASARHSAPLVELDLTLYHHTAQRAALFGTAGDGGAWIAAGSGSLLLRGLGSAQAIHASLAEHIAQQATGAGLRLLIVKSDSSLLPEPLAAAIPIRLYVPPPRARSGDIQLLAHSFAGERMITTRAMHHLNGYAWPENIAELRSILMGAAQLSGSDPIDAMHLPKRLQDVPEYSTQSGIMLPPTGINLEDVEQNLIRQALERAHGNKSKAAELLGLSRHTLLYRMEKIRYYCSGAIVIPLAYAHSTVLFTQSSR